MPLADCLKKIPTDHDIAAAIRADAAKLMADGKPRAQAELEAAQAQLAAVMAEVEDLRGQLGAPDPVEFRSDAQAAQPDAASPAPAAPDAGGRGPGLSAPAEGHGAAALPAVGERVQVSIPGSPSWEGTVTSHIDQQRAKVRPDSPEAVPSSLRKKAGEPIGVHQRFMRSTQQVKAMSVDESGYPSPASTAEVAAVSPIELTGMEISDSQAIEDLRKAAAEYLAQIPRQTEVVNGHTGKSIIIAKEGQRHPVSNRRSPD
jgi:hypothetical protein